MRFTLDSGSGVHTIRSYARDEIHVGEQVVRTSCIVSADTLIAPWETTRAAELQLAQLEPVFALRPEIVLLGTGARQEFPPAAVRREFAARAIGLETMDVGAACRTFNVLVQEERKVAAALILG